MTAVEKSCFYFFTITLMEARTLISALLGCGYLDVDYLIGLMETHGFDGWDLIHDLEYL